MSLTKIGRYQILGELGRGAMGVVYRALDPNIGREVAIKTIHLDLQEAEAVERFRREAKAAGNLSHPNIVTIYDAGEDNGIFYIAMELLDGESLQQRLAKGSVTIGEMASILEQISAALDYAHGRHVVHRDIKPGNIMFDEGHVKVMDFGLAKITSTMASATNRVVGTPSYMSPEQITGGTIDGRSDIFSLGAMLYEMLAGARPFRGDNIAAVMFQIMREDPEPLLNVNPSIPPGLDAIVAKAIAKEPAQRYQTCGELIEKLRACVGIEAMEPAVASRTRPTGVAPLPVRSRATTGSSETLVETLVKTVAADPPHGAGGLQKQRTSLREQWKAASLAGAGLVLLLIAGLAYWQAGPQNGIDSGGENEIVAPDTIGQPPAAESGATPQRAAPAQPSPPPPEPAPPAATSTPPAPAAAAGAVGRVVVHTEPQGARIFVNDEETSYRTPVNFALAPGTYQIRVERPGYDNQTQEIVVRSDASASVQFELQPNGERRSLLPFR